MAPTDDSGKAEWIKREVEQRLQPKGLLPLGWFSVDAKPALLIGNVGSSLWPSFQNSAEFVDGMPDPMNRWTQASITGLVDTLPAGLVTEVRFPFGDQIWPFQDYAQRALGIAQSPIGLLIHPEYGLWTAYRAVLVFAESFEFPAPDGSSGKHVHPCDSCEDKPCLNTCPIGAFSVDGYDYVSCKKYVASAQGIACLESGCAARQACPVGRHHINDPAHQAFHMRAYI